MITSMQPLFIAQLLNISTTKLSYTVGTTVAGVNKFTVKFIEACNQDATTDYYLYYSITSSGGSEIVLCNKQILQKQGEDSNTFSKYVSYVLNVGDKISFWADINAKIGLGAWGIEEK